MPILDQGYQHWTGQLAGHAWRWLAITRHGVRTGKKNRFLRAFLLISWLPAVALVFVLCLWGLLERKSEAIAPLLPFLRFLGADVLADPRHYRIEIWTVCYNYFFWLEMWLSMIMILMVGPNLISQDLRFNALPLYLSRPLRRIDYFLGKLGVITAFISMVTIVPAVIAYALGLFFSLDLSILRDTFGLLLAAIVYGLVISLSAGLLVLALSSISRNSRYVGLFWIGILLIGLSLYGVLELVNEGQHRAAYHRRFVETHPYPRHDATLSPEQQVRAQMRWSRDYEQAMEQFHAEAVRSAREDWRPLVSYTGNLSRIGWQLFGTNKAWESFARILPPPQRDRFLSDFLGPQYPWPWSAAVLSGLLIFSAGILNSKVKSLDRLK